MKDCEFQNLRLTFNILASSELDLIDVVRRNEEMSFFRGSVQEVHPGVKTVKSACGLVTQKEPICPRVPILIIYNNILITIHLRIEHNF